MPHVATIENLSRRVAHILLCYEGLGTEMFADRIWPCDVGAVVLAELADRAGLMREIITGTYRHASAASYEHATGNDRGIAEADGAYPEHHTWITIGSEKEDEEPLLIDPNGELRGERRVQPLTGTEHRYAPFEKGSQWIELPSDVTAGKLIAEGWDERLRAAIERLENISPRETGEG